jgi:hypothetical protein
MGVTAGYFKIVYDTQSINGYNQSLAHYKNKSVEELMCDLIRAEGVHKVHPSIIQAYLVMKGNRPVPSNGASHTPIVLGNGAFKKPGSV